MTWLAIVGLVDLADRIPEGVSVAAVVATVSLFLRHLRTQRKSTDDIVLAATQRIEIVTQEWRADREATGKRHDRAMERSQETFAAMLDKTQQRHVQVQATHAEAIREVAAGLGRVESAIAGLVGEMRAARSKTTREGSSQPPSG